MGQRKEDWLLTAFEKKNSALDNTTDTGKTSERGKRNDTATPQSTVSDGKVANNSASDQEDGVENGGVEEYVSVLGCESVQLRDNKNRTD